MHSHAGAVGTRNLSPPFINLFTKLIRAWPLFLFHQDSDTLFPLPILPHRKNVALMNYRTRYNILDKRGIMNKEAFQTLLTEELVR